jgi:phospholipid/cholesterol/gamma-HCH transport system substrate-binding protein
MLDKADRSVDRIQGIVIAKEETIKNAMDNFNRAMKKANILLNEGTSLVSGTDASISELMQHLVVVTQNMESASENLNQLMELLADQPSQLLFGQPPTPRNVDAGNNTP